jgi:hypothetical protein
MFGLLLLGIGMLFAVPAVLVGMRPLPSSEAFYG